MDLVFIIAAAFALFFALLLFNKEKRSHPDIILSIWLSLIMFQLIVVYAQHSGAYIDYPHLLGITDSFVFLYGPLHFLYVVTAISKVPRFKKVYSLHVIPFLCNTVIYLPFYLKDGSQKIVDICSDAVNDIINTAKSMGLKANWNSFIKYHFNDGSSSELKENLDIPDEYTPYYAISIGYGK